MELDATGIEGRNQKLLELQTKFETLMKSAKDGLEVDASDIAATVQADVLAAVGELRTLTPKLPELPSGNLQSAFRDLTGLTAGSNHMYCHSTLVVNNTPDGAAADSLCPPLGGAHCSPSTAAGSPNIFVGD